MPPVQERNENRPRAAIDQYTHGLSEEIRQQMAPLIEDSIRVYDWAVARLSKHGLTPTKADLLLKGNVNSGDNPADPGFAFEHELAAEFRHTVHHVTVTALKLKRFMLEQEMPERVIAYQSGTGFPLPEEIEGKVEKIGFLQFGKGILTHIPKADHKRDDRPEEDESPEESPAGMYFYKVTADNGREMTLIALKGRYHGYSAVASGMSYPHHRLAILPRVLKGIGIEEVFTTFASGYDGVPEGDEAMPETGDYGYILNFADLFGEQQRTDPALGIQTILAPLYGGPYQGTTELANGKMSITLMEKAIRHVYPDGKMADGTLIPARHGTLFYDGPAPHFENSAHWARARVNAAKILQTPGMFDTEIIAEIPSTVISTNQGMSSWSEIMNYNLSIPKGSGGVESVFNRKVKVTSLTSDTDTIDPRTGGQSHKISDDAVREAGKKGAAFFAPVVSEYARQIASFYKEGENLSGLMNELDKIPQDSKSEQDQLDRLLLEEIQRYQLKDTMTVKDFYEDLVDMRGICFRDAQEKPGMEASYKIAVLYDNLAARLAEYMGIEHEGYRFA
ncbi:hypothetical protein A2781_00815 [Candidatus Gottesmanbacteria bacterium RIFCSPHIGHO2_01_FULL_42_27]|uniref:Uncharacterized protein n=2 Tax=Candidatus Gottesmaniibacteriota TaxID=1752720 RepID=A0A1F6BJT5_9BACT|nr:MAG: hypothetical protein UV09_C0006G0020 [Candidatus Gottesmanbacteria bacterium GW2011_GWA2_42_18]KKS75040.1 MAG: hypothetical protein UV46_C0027G0013 [Candidatus Gottesmanbacteria bacterium GW2011_GWC2_42_8]OGG09702.1 MAG: hypothetical protein A2781_00815 [Candidatus Gottesmanbacteria bacterium RIFCSPHIGHO2_01_FULL_42_27]OGG22516.1 MAG: hypothetical protein A3E72_03655 [Candidatus Gottesmanbacteria bacterium RIFCSPHIGHO2_12_FULL_43_26]OGG34886.1 MAG: hypothetical protein A3G68_04405 [Cand